MSDDIPLSCLALLLSPPDYIWLALAILLSLGCGVLLQGLLLGIQSRSVARPAAWRCLQAAVLLLVLATAVWRFVLWLEADSLGELGHAVPSPGYLNFWGDGFLFAVLASLVFSVLLGLAGQAGPRRGGMSWGVGIAVALGRVLTPWGNLQKGSRNGDDNSEFEITMASGEEVEAAERELIENILEMGDTTVREVMKPRPDVVALDISWPAERILAEVAGARFSRFPVYEDTIDNVIGVLHLRDLFEFLARGDGTDNFTLRELLMDPLFLPESKKVDDALRDLQKHKSHMAIVLDEYGGTAGVVTIEDLLEEIVGEIQDEYDDESKLVHQREDGSYVVTAQLPLDDLAELLGLDLQAEDVDTVGGYIVDALGRIPAVNDQLDCDGLRFTILSVEKNRIGRVRIERLSL
ncbi:HlyC/CorC family transporter [bacterium]|nr:HlyC/CorC family transporter [bacterium]